MCAPAIARSADACPDAPRESNAIVTTDKYRRTRNQRGELISVRVLYAFWSVTCLFLLIIPPVAATSLNGPLPTSGLLHTMTSAIQSITQNLPGFIRDPIIAIIGQVSRRRARMISPRVKLTMTSVSFDRNAMSPSSTMWIYHRPFVSNWPFPKPSASGSS